jgi:uncharacterized membrane protein
MEYVNQAMDALKDGFGQINHPQGLIIALIAALLMPSWRQWLIMALLATAIHIAVIDLPGILQGHGLPNFLEQAFWTSALGWFLGYLIIIGVFFFLKSLVARGGGSTAKAH